MAFPTTGVLDTGVRADEGPPPSASWLSTGVGSATPSLLIVSNTIRDNTDESGSVWGTVFGPNTEVYETFTVFDPINGRTRSMYLRLLQTGGATVDGYRGTIIRQDSNPGYNQALYRIDNNVSTQLGAVNNNTAGVVADGTKFGMDMISDTLSFYDNRSGTWSSALYTRTDSTYTGAGSIGAYLSEDQVNDFGGGTIGGAASTGLAWIRA